MHQCINVSHVVSWQLHMPKISLSMQSNTSRTAGKIFRFFFFLMCGLSQLQCKSNNHTVIALKKMVGEFICESSMLHSLVIGKSQVDSSVLNVYLWLLYSMLHAVWHASAEAMWWYTSFEKLLYIPRRACRWDFFIEVTSFLLLAHIP